MQAALAFLGPVQGCKGMSQWNDLCNFKLQEKDFSNLPIGMLPYVKKAL